jgi:hypothetical protein
MDMTWQGRYFFKILVPRHIALRIVDESPITFADEVGFSKKTYANGRISACDPVWWD